LRKVLLFAALAGISVPVYAATIASPNLGTAASYGLIGGTISNTGASVVTGNVGALTTITGFPAGTATGTVFPAGSPNATAAYNDFVQAYIDGFSDIVTPPTQSVADLSVSRSFTGNNVFEFTAIDVVSVTGITLTFDAQNDSSEVFIIKTLRDLTINGPLTFSLINNAAASNIYWIVGRAAVLGSAGPTLTWDGSIIAGTSFTMSANGGGPAVLAGNLNGCVFAETANTLAGQTNVGGCVSSAGASVPEPGTAAMLGMACCLGGFALRRRRRKI
jgi:hypothetical protein